MIPSTLDSVCFYSIGCFVDGFSLRGIVVGPMSGTSSSSLSPSLSNVNSEHATAALLADGAGQACGDDNPPR